MFVGLHPWIAHNTQTSTALKKVCAHKGLYLKNGYCQTIIENGTTMLDKGGCFG